jgi:hypothetical protein
VNDWIHGPPFSNGHQHGVENKAATNGADSMRSTRRRHQDMRAPYRGVGESNGFPRQPPQRWRKPSRSVPGESMTAAALQSAAARASGNQTGTKTRSVWLVLDALSRERRSPATP